MTAADQPVAPQGMRARLVQLTKLTAGYGLVSLAGPFFTLVLTPLYTRVLHPDDYAVLDTTTTLGILILTFGTLGLNGALAVFFHDGDQAYQRRLISTAITIGAICSLAISLLLAVIARPLAAFSLGAERWAILLYLSAGNLPFAVVYTIVQSALRLQLAVKRANILAIAYLILTTSLNILFVLILHWGVLGIQLAISFTTVVLTIVSIVLTRRDVWGRPSRKLVRPLLKAGFPFVPASLSFWALAYIDRLLLPSFSVALHDRGLYAIANKLASMLAIVIVPFQNAWGPLALSMRNEADAGRTYSKVLTYFLAAGLAGELAIGLFAREILLVFTTREYVAAAPFVGLLAYVSIANGASVAVGVGAYLSKRTDILGWTTMVGAAMNLLLNLLLIPRFGVWGAVWATTLGYIAVPVALYLVAQRVHPVPFEVAKVVRALAIQIVLLAMGFFIQTGNMWLDIVLKSGLVLLYGVALIIGHILEANEVRALLRVLSRRTSPQSLVQQ